MKTITKWVPILLLCITSLFSRPYQNEPFQFKQPDGSMVPVLISGDEFYQHVETPDGYTVIRADDGWIRYAEISTDSSSYIPGEIYRAAGTVQRNAVPQKKHQSLNQQAILKIVNDTKTLLQGGNQTRAASRAVIPGNMVGTFKGITLLVDFSDRPATIASADFKEMLNGDNYTGYGNVCSVKEWFSTVSEGKLTYLNEVVGYYRAKHPFTYYDDPAVQFGTRGVELAKEILDSLQNAGFDFSSFTVSNGGIPVNIFYAGAQSADWGKGLWPHSGWFAANTIYGGKPFKKYQITNVGSSLEIGTFIHENGHMLLGYPDLYPYVDGVPDQWVREYCTMGKGATDIHKNNPVPFNPYFRASSGWIDPIDLAQIPNSDITVTPTELGDIRKYSRLGSSSESYFIDARAKTGHSIEMPSQGLLIWKVNTAGDNTNNPTTPLIRIVDTDNNGWIGAADDYYVNIPGTAFSSSTPSSSNWDDGTPSGLTISKVSPFGITMNYQVGTGGTPDLDTITASVNNSAWGTISPNGQTVVASGSSKLYTFSASTGYKLDSLLVNGQNTGLGAGDTQYEIVNISSNGSIQAFFSPILCSDYQDWISTTRYIYGVKVTYNGHIYESDLWESGNQPDINSNGLGKNCWIDLGECRESAVSQFAVTASVNNSLYGSISPAGTTTADSNSTLSFIVTPNSGFKVDSVTYGSTKLIAVNGSYTTPAITQNGEVIAWFSEDKAVPVLQKKKSSLGVAVVNENPVPSTAPAVTFTMPNQNGTYTITILDVTGNVVFSQKGAGNSIRWDLTNEQGTRVSGSFKVIIQILDGSGVSKFWESVLGVQK